MSLATSVGKIIRPTHCQNFQIPDDSIVISVDWETYLFIPGNRAPRAICLSWCDGTNYGLLNREDGLNYLEAWLENDRVILSGTHMVFDACATAANRPRLLKKLFEAYDKGRIICTKNNDYLLDIMTGEHTTKEKGRYSNAGMVKRYFDVDRSESKGKGSAIFQDKDFLETLAHYQYINGFLSGVLPEEFACLHLIGRENFTQEYAAALKTKLLSAVGDNWESIPPRIRYAEMDGKAIDEYPENFKTYAIDDTRWDWMLNEAQMKKANKVNYTDGKFRIRDAARQTANDFALGLVSSWGFRTDWKQVQYITNPIEEGLLRLNKELEAIGFLRYNDKGKYRGSYSVNENRVKEAVKRAYESTGRVPPSTETGGISISGETLLESGDPDLDKFSERDRYADLKTKWLPVLKRGILQPVHTNFTSILNTGRTSSFDFNSQNIDRQGGLRECFIPRDGFYYCSVDYGALELRTLAQACLWWFSIKDPVTGSYYIPGKSKLADTFHAKIDPHCVTGASILNCTLEDFLKGLKDDKKTKEYRLDKPTPYADARQLAKAMNFGLPGGLGAEAFVMFAKQQYGVILVKDPITGKMDVARSIKRAEDLKQIFKKTYPEVADYMSKVGVMCGGHRSRYRAEQFVSGRLRGECSYTAGCNTYFQGLAADGAKHACYEVVRECYTGFDRFGKPSVLFGARVVTFVHDELVCEIPIARANECALRIQQVMEEIMAMYVPDVPIIAPPAIARRWYKDMDPCFDENGSLIPWEPRQKS